MLRYFSMVMLMTCCSSILCAQNANPPILHDSIFSKALQETRPFDVVLPENYDSATPETYEMIYVMDAEWSTRIVSNIHEFLAIDFMPHNIIIGVHNTPSGGNNMRGRDFTVKDSNNAESGGADKFLSFLKNELLPYVNKKYKSSNVNTYIGSSLGGLFGMYAMLKEPRLFSSWLLADPAFWWDHDRLIKMAAEKLPGLTGIPLTLLITGREGEAFNDMRTHDMDSVLKAKAPASLHWRVNKYTGETHNAMIFRTSYDGLKLTYEGFVKDELNFYPRNGSLLPGKPIVIHFGNDQLKGLRYTTDGSQPTDSSAPVTSEISISKAETLTIRASCYRHRYDKSASGLFVSGTTAVPVAKIKNLASGGLHFDYYEGRFDSMPDFAKLKPVKSGKTSKDFDIAKLPRQQDFALAEEGQIQTLKDGYYLIGLDCEGGAKLYIGDKLVIDYSANHSAGAFQSYVLPLAKGFYRIRLEYFHRYGTPSLIVPMINPGEENADLIPINLLYGR